ncbi:hypothetical protein [Yinghuangia soli]|uniref:Uncharacterized protein n=1 Tax=Yinghuangia soli TaxID=2908204 RepID=A0AA41Q656_9ACTN|nr:hypothetical protein [Yinghuangia soli]MCF2531381.1 hypothetical protein [Yinghuangia soli]
MAELLGSAPSGNASVSAKSRTYQDRSEPLAYPTAYETYCQVLEPGGVLPVFEYAIRRTYQDIQWPGGLPAADSGPILLLGEGLVGSSSQAGAWIRVPQCRADDGTRYAQIAMRPSQRPAPNALQSADGLRRRQSLVAMLIETTNALRTKAGCIGDPIPIPAPRTPPASVPALPGSLCGTVLPASPAPLRYAPAATWTESWSGFDDRLEDCLVVDNAPGTGSEAGARPLLRVQTYRGELARLEISVIQEGDPAGTMHTTQLQGAQSTFYWGVCANGPVIYRVETATRADLPTAESLLTALIAANTSRDGCSPPGPDIRAGST